MLVVLEGGEGCGKSTQTRRLYRRLLEEGYSSLLVHEPGGTHVGEQIRRLLKSQRRRHSGSSSDAMSPLTELLLFAAARSEMVNTVLRPALEEGRVVLCDRFTPSTVAYQGYGRGISLETIGLANQLTTTGLEPDLVILLDMPPEDGLRRISVQASLNFDVAAGPSSHRRDEEGSRRFEEEPLSFHRNVRRAYLELAGAEPERWFVVDGTLPEEQIADITWHRVESLLRGGK